MCVKGTIPHESSNITNCVFICRFKVEQKLDLRSTLQELGINSIFTNDADLSGMTGILCARTEAVSSVLEPSPPQPDSVDTSQSEKKSAEGGRRVERREELRASSLFLSAAAKLPLYFPR